MRQPELRGQPGLVVIIAAVLVCLWNPSATAADYYKPAEFSVPPGTSIIHAGTLLAVPGKEPSEQQSIVIQNGKVVEIRDGYAGAADIGVASGILGPSGHHHYSCRNLARRSW